MYITEVSNDVASPVPLSLLRAFPAAADPDPATAATVGRGHQERPTVGVIVRGRSDWLRVHRLIPEVTNGRRESLAGGKLGYSTTVIPRDSHANVQDRIPSL